MKNSLILLGLEVANSGFSMMQFEQNECFSCLYC